MRKAVREAEKAIGEVKYDLSEKVKKSRVFGRSIFVVEEIKEGELITEKNVRSIRPGYGLHPQYLKSICGKKANFHIRRGAALKWEMIS